jgi:hypothetical protein
VFELPICAQCQKEEVKPGDDLCFACLGEIPTEDEDIFSAEMKQYYSKKLLDRLVPALIHASHGLSNTP